MTPRTGLYVGIQTPGTTSQMRWDTLCRIRPGCTWDAVDTDVPYRSAGRLSRSLAFRGKLGPVVSNINHDVAKKIANKRWDIVWVDKGVYLRPQTTAKLRQAAGNLIYYTPDTSFYANRSRHFNRSMNLYDLVVTTKSFEMDEFQSRLAIDRIHLTTQAFDPRLHHPAPPERKVIQRNDAVFIGLCEPDRESAIATLLAASIPVRVGGRGWDRFCNKYGSHRCFTFIGDAVFGNDYVDAYRSASVGLGLLSKRFPEMHTTRTFEIPACGTVLATEKNADTERFFRSDDVLFFDSYEDLAIKLREVLADENRVQSIAQKGYQRVVSGGFSYDDVVGNALDLVFGSEGERGL